jgi:type VI protein secretion system component VasF
MAPMAIASPVPPPEGVETRDQRRQRLLAQLQAAAAPLLEQMADTLTDAPDRELFRSVEVRLRDLGQQVAAAAHQAGLDDRKKGAT